MIDIMKNSSSPLIRLSLGTMAVQAVLACCQPVFAEGLLDGSSLTSTVSVAAPAALIGEFDAGDLQKLDHASDDTARAVRIAVLEQAVVNGGSRFVDQTRHAQVGREAEAGDVFVHTRLAMPLLAAPVLSDAAKPLQPMSGLAVGVRPAYARPGFFAGFSHGR